MATKTITTLIDDIDGTEATRTVTFSYDKINYSIDLNDANAKDFSDAFKAYIKFATVIGTRRSSNGPVKSNKGELDAARTWLRANGQEVSDRGRIKGELMELFLASN